MAEPRRIVAEITRNWRRDDDPGVAPLLSHRFEAVIASNSNRGYELEHWQFQSVLISHPNRQDVLIETIIAVFVLREAPGP